MLMSLFTTLATALPIALSVGPSSRTPAVAPRRYLVTGGRGFIGRHLLRRLVESGAQVHATTRSTTPPQLSGVSWWSIDLTDTAATEHLINQVRPDVVVHLASRADGTRQLDAVLPILTDNLLGTVSVLSAAARLPQCKVIVAGSVEDGGGGRHPDVHSPYAASKAATSTYTTLFRDLWQLNVTVLRLAMVYGPDDPNSHRLVPSVIAAFRDGRAPSITSGTRMIDWIHVDDVVDALLAASSAPPTVVDIGSGKLVSIRDTVELIAQAMATPILPEYGGMADRPQERNLRADPGPARKTLHWRPTVTLPAGIAHTVAHSTAPDHPLPAQPGPARAHHQDDVVGCGTAVNRPVPVSGRRGGERSSAVCGGREQGRPGEQRATRDPRR